MNLFITTGGGRRRRESFLRIVNHVFEPARRENSNIAFSAKSPYVNTPKAIACIAGCNEDAEATLIFKVHRTRVWRCFQVNMLTIIITITIWEVHLHMHSSAIPFSYLCSGCLGTFGCRTFHIGMHTWGTVVRSLIFQLCSCMPGTGNCFHLPRTWNINDMSTLPFVDCVHLSR